MNKANCHFCGEDVPAIKQRIAELEKTQERLVAFSADNSRELQKQVDRLRELLQTILKATEEDDCVWVGRDMQDRIKAELAKGE